MQLIPEWSIQAHLVWLYTFETCALTVLTADITEPSCMPSQQYYSYTNVIQVLRGNNILHMIFPLFKQVFQNMIPEPWRCNLLLRSSQTTWCPLDYIDNVYIVAVDNSWSLSTKYFLEDLPINGVEHILYSLMHWIILQQPQLCINIH